MLALESLLSKMKSQLDRLRTPDNPVFLPPHNFLNFGKKFKKHFQRYKIIENDCDEVLSWTPDIVIQWIIKKGFLRYKEAFLVCKVDGDLLFRLNEESLINDIGMTNGIDRMRFMRELNHLKCAVYYSSKDQTRVNDFLKNLGFPYCQYTYQMLLAGVQVEDLKNITSEELLRYCGISSSIHREKIIRKADGRSHQSASEMPGNSLNAAFYDVFISYRRSNGSMLASLLRTFLIERGLSVFFDVCDLKGGRFDTALLNAIRQTKSFLLVLTPDALDRCINDEKCEDWVHKEIAQALKYKRNIILVLDNFKFPSTALPKDIQLVQASKRVQWNLEEQEACIDVIQSFILSQNKTFFALDDQIEVQAK